MGIVQRQGIFNTLILYAGIAIGFVNEVLLLRNFLSEEEVGLVKILILATTIYAQLALLGGSNTMIRFFPFYKERDKEHGGILFGTGLIAAIGFVLVSLLLVFFREPIEARYIERSQLFVEYFYLLIPLGAFTVAFNLIEAYSKAKFRTIAPTFIKEFLLRLLVTICISLFAFKVIDFDQFVKLFVVANCSIALWLAIYLLFKAELRWRPAEGIEWTALLGYGLFALLSGISNYLSISIDSLMLGAQIGLDTVGIYTTGVYFTSVVMVPGRALLRISAPLVAEYWKENDMDKMDTLYKKVSLNNTIVSGLVFILIYINIYEVFSLMKPEYLAAVNVFFILGLARLFDLATGINGLIILNSKDFRYETLFNILLALIAIGFNYWLIPLHGMTGAALATMLAIIVFNSLRLGFVWFRFGLFPFSWRNLVIVALGVVCCLIGLYIPSLGDGFIFDLLNMALRSIVVSAIFGLIVIRLGYSEEITNLSNVLLTRLRGWFGF